MGDERRWSGRYELVYLFKAWLNLEEMERRSRAKSSLIYGEIDAHPSFYRTIVSPECRSRINIVFRLQSEELEKKFIAEAASAGFVGLAGNPHMFFLPRESHR